MAIQVKAASSPQAWRSMGAKRKDMVLGGCVGAST